MPERCVQIDGPFEEQTDVAFVRNAHGAMKMYRAPADRSGGLARARLGGENREFARLSVAARQGLDSVDDSRAGEFRIRPHLDKSVLNRLKTSDRLSKLDAALGVVDRDFESARCEAREFGGEGDAGEENGRVNERADIP